MPSPFSAILRGVNREPGQPLNILCADTHEAYQTVLAKTGHLFFSLQQPGWKTWDTRFRPLPGNLQPISPQMFAQPDLAFDLVLSQHKFGQYQVLSQIAMQLNCPLISVEHTLPQRGLPAAQLEAMRRMCGDVNVYLSRFSVDAWKDTLDNPTNRLLEIGVDAEFFQGWKGGDGRVLTVQNQYPQRGDVLGWPIYQAATQGLPINPVGDSPGFSRPARDPDHLLSLYQNASVFLNTTTWSTCPVALLEAMSVGCPVVTTATCMLPTIIEHGVNGYISNDPQELRACLIELLSNHALAARMGQAARQTILGRFTQQRMIQEWNQLFAETVDKPASSWMGGAQP
jgi:hypothetical protein